MISTTVTHAPTIAYHLNNAILFDGSIYAGVAGFPFYPKGDKSLSVSMHVGLVTARHALASTYLGTRFFGHWLVDDCTKYLLAEAVAPTICRDLALATSENIKHILGRIEHR